MSSYILTIIHYKCNNPIVLFQLNIWDFPTKIPLSNLPTCTIIILIQNKFETISKLWVIINLKAQKGNGQDVNIF